MNRVLDFIKTNKYFCLISLILLIIPFSWFSKDLYILGEDDTGLVYYNTIGVLQESFSVWFSVDSIARFEESAGHLFVFSFIILIFKTITFGLINVQQLFFGILLSCSFMYIVRILELMTGKKNPAFYLAGLFYALSPYFVMTEYYYLMASTFGILLAPAVTFYLLKAIHDDSWRPLLLGALWTFALSRVLTTPAFINFYVLLGVFIFIYSIVMNQINLKKSVMYFFLLTFFIVLINTMLIIPLIQSVRDSSSGALGQTIADRTRVSYLEDMVLYIKKEIELNRLIYFLSNTFPQPISLLQGFRNYEFYPHYIQKTLFMMLSIALCTFSGLVIAVRKKNRTVLPVLILFFISLVFISVNILDITRQFYYFLMLNTPIFNMNRIPSMKFHISFIFYYTLLVGISLQILYEHLSKKWKKLLIQGIFISILIHSFFFWSGRVFTQKLPPAYTVRAMNFNADYLKLTKEIGSVVKDDASFLLFPMGYGFGAFIMGEDSSQFYRAPITGFKSFTGKKMFGSVRSLGSVLDPSIAAAAKKFYFKHSTAHLYALTSKLNIKYVVVSKDIEPLRQFAELLPEQTYESTDYLKPLNLEKPVYSNEGYNVYKLKNYDEVSLFTTENSDTQLSFKKVADFMYLVKINTSIPDNLIMNEGFSQNWNLYSFDEKLFSCENEINYAKKFPNIKECTHQNNTIAGNKQLFGNLDAKPFETAHTRYNDFGNSWKIDTGGKDTYLMVLFDGQKYYLLGLGISFLMCGIFISTAIYYGKRRS